MTTISLKTSIPGPRSQALLARRKTAVPQGPFNIAPIFVECGDGATVTDVDGNVLLDYSGGLGSLNLGLGNAKIFEAVAKQAQKFLHTCFHITQYEPTSRLPKNLTLHSNMLRYLVPWVITDEQLDEGLEVIERQIAA